VKHVRQIANRISELRPLSAWATEIARGLGSSESRCRDIDLCLTEAVANIICHGYSDDAPHEITVELASEPGALVMRIEDDARPFDPLARSTPQPPSLDEATPTGRGILLMRSTAASMSYERVGSRNRLTLRFVVDEPSHEPPPVM